MLAVCWGNALARECGAWSKAAGKAFWSVNTVSWETQWDRYPHCVCANTGLVGGRQEEHAVRTTALWPTSVGISSSVLSPEKGVG